MIFGQFNDCTKRRCFKNFLTKNPKMRFYPKNDRKRRN